MSTTRRLAVPLTALCLIALALLLATLASATTVHAGNLILNFNGSVSPKTLPKSTKAPISLNVNGTIGTVDGSQPPAAKEIIVDTDKNGEVNATGLPICTGGPASRRAPLRLAEKACPEAIVGKGSTEVQRRLSRIDPVHRQRTRSSSLTAAPRAARPFS